MIHLDNGIYDIYREDELTDMVVIELDDGREISVEYDPYNGLVVRLDGKEIDIG
jgi:hypothetical protein